MRDKLYLNQNGEKNYNHLRFSFELSGAIKAQRVMPFPFGPQLYGLDSSIFRFVIPVVGMTNNAFIMVVREDLDPIADYGEISFEPQHSGGLNIAGSSRTFPNNGTIKIYGF